MTMQKSFKRLVRARMRKTGESYTAARAKLLAAEAPKANEGPALSVSDEVIRDRTGRGWEEWLHLLDESDAADRPTKEIRRWIEAEHGIEGWGAAAVSVTYARARGLRAVGEGPDGFTVSATKTVAVGVDRLYEAFVDESLRAAWLPDGELRERTALKPKSIRFDWSDGGGRVNAFFTAKGDVRSTATVQHERLPDGEDAERMKAYWRDRVATLKEVLERD